MFGILNCSIPGSSAPGPLGSPRRWLGPLLALVVLAASCGGDDTSDDAADDGSASASASAPTDDGTDETTPSNDDVAASSTDADTDGTETETPPEADSTTAGDTITIEHPGGTSEVPVGATPALALDENTAFLLWGLGVEPDAVYGSFFTVSGPVVAAEFGLEVTPHNLSEPSIEATADLGPQVIVGTDHPATLEAYDLWSAVAPTVLLPYSGAWQDQLRLAASAFGVEERAEAQIAALDGEIDRVATRVAEQFDEPPSVSVIASLNNTPFAIAAVGETAALLDRLGFARPEAQQVEVDPSFPFAFFSPELVNDHDADYVLTMGGGIYDDLTGVPLYDSLQGERVVVDGEAWNGSHPFAIAWMLADIEAVVLDGGPAATLDDTLARWTAYRALSS